MDADYLLRAKQRHHAHQEQEEKKRQAAEQQALEERKRLEEERKAENAREWQEYQRKTLTELGYSERDVQRLLKPERYDTCVNWEPTDWEGEQLPFAYPVTMNNGSTTTMGYNLRQIMMTHDRGHLTAAQSRHELGVTDAEWRQMVRQWEIVNPYPVRPLSMWQDYQLLLHPTPLDEVMTEQVFGTPQQDVLGSGSIQVPRTMYRYIQEQTSTQDDLWNAKHPFLVVQIMWTNPHQQQQQCTDFAVLQLHQECCDDGHLRISCALQKRTKLQANQKVSARLVTLVPIRPSHRGVGMKLQLCHTAHTFEQQEHKVDDQALQKLLQQTLEKLYIVVRGQWIALVDKNYTVWIYKVLQVFSAENHPVAVAAVYNTQVAIEVVIPERDVKQALPEFMTVLNNW